MEEGPQHTPCDKCGHILTYSLTPTGKVSKAKPDRLKKLIARGRACPHCRTLCVPSDLSRDVFSWEYFGKVRVGRVCQGCYSEFRLLKVKGRVPQYTKTWRMEGGD